MKAKFRAAWAAACVLAWAPLAAGGQLQICDIQPNIDYSCDNCTPTARELPIAVFDFSAQPGLASFNAINGIQFTVAMQVPNPANTGLRLALNGIDTGIALDGFERDTLVAKTFAVGEGDAGWLTPEKESQLLQSLRDRNGEVTASILADTPEQLRLQLYSDTDVKLCLDCLTPDAPSTVPEPAALLTWGLAAAAAAWRRRTA